MTAHPPVPPISPTSPSSPVPPISSRHEPRFRSGERKQQLAAAFQDQGEDYDRLRPGYPDAVIDAILAHAHDGVPRPPASATHSSPPQAPPAHARSGPTRVIDLGAGTGKLAWALAERGVQVTAVDTSAAMLETLRARASSAMRPDPATASAARSTGATPDAPMAATSAPDQQTPALSTHLAAAESTGLPAASAHLVTAAQAWHWFDASAATAEATRLLAPGGVLALVWNTMDVTIPWVHRLSRIMHAGDVQREDFLPTVGPQLTLVDRVVHHWEDPLPTHDLIDLARTRSYVITATEERRQKVLANLDWYLHEHLGHEPGSVVGLPYRTDLFLYRHAVEGPAPHRPATDNAATTGSTH